MTEGERARSLPEDVRGAVPLGGEMGARFAAFDWDSHPLGAVSEWSPELTAIVAIALSSRFPTVLFLGRELRIVYNDGYIPMLGARHPDALGMPVSEVWWDIVDTIVPMLNSVLDTGVATWSDDLMLPLVTRGRPEERYFTFTFSPILSAAGTVSGVFCPVNETTDRVIGERRLALLNTLSSALLDCKTDADVVATAIEKAGSFRADLPFVAVYLDDPPSGRRTLRQATPNVQRLLRSTDPAALSPADLNGTSGVRVISDLQHRLPGLAATWPEDCPEQAIAFDLVDPSRGRSIGTLCIGISPSRPLDTQYEALCRLIGEQIAAALANVRAYESERARADALASLDRAKTVFLTNVSHEFRTPLTLLLGPLEDAIEGVASDPIQSARLRTVHRNGQRLLRLVNSLLDFSRVEAGQSAPNARRLDLGAFTAGIAASFAEVCERAGLDLQLACEPTLAAVDVDMWETVMLNLLSNAVKYTLRGSIRVSLDAGVDGRIRCQVADTGSGIEADQLDRLFERFYRADNARGRSVEGSGIGLALVRSLVEAHRGTVRIDSIVDVGTTVTVTLPPDDAADASAQVVDQAQPAVLSGQRSANAYLAEASSWLEDDSTDPAWARGGRPLIMIVDDNADMRAHLRQILGSRWDTVSYGDGDRALTALPADRPDLVITDVMMPALDGFGFVRAIRADPALANTPVIMLSARAGPEAAGVGLDAGADDYLAKPFSSGELIDRAGAKLRAGARTHQLQVQARDAADSAAQLARLGTALSSALSSQDMLAALAACPISALDSPALALGVLDGTGQQIRVGYAGDAHRELVDRYHLMSIDAPVPIATVVRSGTPMIVTDTATLGLEYQVAVRDAAPSVRASFVYPVRDGEGGVLGALGLLWPAPHNARPDHDEQLGQVLTLIGAALERLRISEHEHDVVADMQQRLLTIDTPAAAVSAVYRPATEAMRIGGDWYVAADLAADGCIGIAVGDVVGHGLEAATVMSQLRSALAAAALADSDPATVLEILDRYARSVTGASCSTVAYAVHDGVADTLRYMCAGHPYPVLVGPEAVAHLLDEGRRPPLAAERRPARRTAVSGECAFPPGSLLVLYTDGLIERRDEGLDDGLKRLTEAAARCHDLPVAEVCQTLLTELAPGDGFVDDVVVTALRAKGATETSFVDAFPAHSSQVSEARHRLQAWLGRLELDEPALFDILLGVGEAVTNAIEHGSNNDPRQGVLVEAFAGDAAITVTISDRGRWHKDSAASHRSGPRGRGLTVMHSLAARSRIARTSRGTHVTLIYPRT